MPHSPSRNTSTTPCSEVHHAGLGPGPCLEPFRKLRHQELTIEGNPGLDADKLQCLPQVCPDLVTLALAQPGIQLPPCCRQLRSLSRVKLHAKSLPVGGLQYLESLRTLDLFAEGIGGVPPGEYDWLRLRQYESEVEEQLQALGHGPCCLQISTSHHHAFYHTPRFDLAWMRLQVLQVFCRPSLRFGLPPELRVLEVKNNLVEDGYGMYDCAPDVKTIQDIHLPASVVAVSLIESSRSICPEAGAGQVKVLGRCRLKDHSPSHPGQQVVSANKEFWRRAASLPEVQLDAYGAAYATEWSSNSKIHYFN